MITLDDKVAIITGAAGGIGSETARLFASLGAKLILADLKLDGAEAVAAEIDPSGATARAVHLDLAEEDSVAAMIGFAVDAFGRIDVLDNNAAHLSSQAGPLDRDVETVPVELWDRIFRVNARGTMLACRYALPVMTKQGAGSIINIASNLGIQGHFANVAYSASKAAIIQMSRSVAASHGKAGIRCNVVSPGLTATARAVATRPPRFMEIIESETLTPYLGGPADIASVVAFLASDAARYVSGLNLVADGGNHSHIPGFAALRAFAENSEGTD